MALNYLFRINLKSIYPCFSTVDSTFEKDGQSQSSFKILQDVRQKTIKAKKICHNIFLEKMVFINILSKILICF
ncbi:MAG: hypothetical protein CMD21_02725 [Flavobacteriales bacterium]|nr:hypothetical protein [Flavobacteriales bacterium]